VVRKVWRTSKVAAGGRLGMVWVGGMARRAGVWGERVGYVGVSLGDFNSFL
jgi:hypothetical protein